MRTPVRTLTILATATTLGLVPLACGNDKGSGTADDSGIASAAKCPVGAFEKASGATIIKVWHSYVGKTKLALDDLAAQYNASQDKVVVELEAQGNSYTELRRKFEGAIPTKDLPAITIAEDTETQFMADSGVVLPATACQKADRDAARQTDDILPAVKAAYTLDDVQYPASMNVSTVVLYYNKGDFAAAGLDPEQPPTTLAEVRTAAEKLKAAGVSDKPFVMKMDPWFVEQWTSGAGQTLVNKDNGRSGTATEGTLENPATNGAMQWIADMNTAGLLNAIPGTDGQINHYLAMLPSGSSSMLIETSAAITTINGVLQGSVDPADLGLPEGAPIEIDVTGLDIGVGLNPGLTEPGKGQIGGGAWYITNTGSDEVQSAAWDFVKFFNSTPSQVTWTQDGGYLPILDSAKNDPTLQADWQTSTRGKWLATSYGGITTLDPKFPGALIGPYDRFRQLLRKGLEDVVFTGIPPKSAIATANDGVTTELADYEKNRF